MPNKVIVVNESASTPDGGLPAQQTATASRLTGSAVSPPTVNLESVLDSASAD